jgi:hypothetical protein
MEYREIIQKVVQALGKPDYLEIGVNEGKSFRPVEAERKIGIDPDFRFDYVNRAKPNEKYYQMTSDEYFASHYDVIDGVAFIDGLHSCAQVMRDVDNVLKTMTPDSVILIDDSSPIFESEAVPAKSINEAALIVGPKFDYSWCGDVWKAVAIIRATATDLHVFTVKGNRGLTFVTRGKPENLLSIPVGEILSADYKYLSDARERILNMKDDAYMEEWLIGKKAAAR